MEFFIDTGDIEEIREASTWGIVDGVTTNPSLIAKTGRSQRSNDMTRWFLCSPLDCRSRATIW